VSVIYTTARQVMLKKMQLGWQVGKTGIWTRQERRKLQQGLNVRAYISQRRLPTFLCPEGNLCHSW